jgi:hypothetical protein
MGSETFQSVAFDAPTADRGHVGLDPERLVDEDEAFRIKTIDRPLPASATGDNVGAMLLTGECGFFEGPASAPQETPHRIVRFGNAVRSQKILELVQGQVRHLFDLRQECRCGIHRT